MDELASRPDAAPEMVVGVDSHTASISSSPKCIAAFEREFESMNDCPCGADPNGVHMEVGGWRHQKEAAFEGPIHDGLTAQEGGRCMGRSLDGDIFTEGSDDHSPKPKLPSGGRYGQGAVGPGA